MSTDTTSTCKGCGVTIWVELEKALDGTYASVWASEEGWICEADGNEHRPDSPDSTYQRDLDFATEGMSASELLVDSVFNDVVSDVEASGHSRVRVERDLRAWVEEEGEEPETPMDPEEALTYAILAINDAAEPQATSGNDRLYLEFNSERALAMLVEIREWVIAQGDDFINIGLGRGE